MNRLPRTLALAISLLAIWLVPASAQDGSLEPSPALEAQEQKARSILDALNAAALASQFQRLSIPVAELTGSLPVLVPTQSSANDQAPPESTPPDRQAQENGVDPTTPNTPSPFENLVVKRISVENMQVILGERKTGNEVDAILSILGQSKDRSGLEAREVEDIDDHPGRRMRVFEPTLYFDKAQDGLITVDLDLSWRPDQAFGHSSPSGEPSKKGHAGKPIKIEARVWVRGASIPLDVYFDSELSGVKPIPQRRIEEFKTGTIDVEVRKVGRLKLPAPLRRELTKLIRREFGDVISTEVYKAVAASTASE